MVQQELNSRPLAWQPTVQPIESMVCYVSVRKQLHLIFYFIFPLCLNLQLLDSVETVRLCFLCIVLSLCTVVCALFHCTGKLPYCSDFYNSVKSLSVILDICERHIAYEQLRSIKRCSSRCHDSTLGTCVEYSLAAFIKITQHYEVKSEVFWCHQL